ncbi:MAG: DNA translocase FtsK [Clostridia bacterium]|nr:DNA translocase FtsK [Clostridia bacterium]
MKSQKNKRQITSKKNSGKAAVSQKKKSKIIPLISKAMPYVLAVLFVVTLFCIIGNRGIGIVLKGLLSTCASYFLSILLLFHSLMWYYDVNRKICTRRVVCSIIIVISVATLQQLISSSSDPTLLTLSLDELYQNGINSIGGGGIGGAIGNFFATSNAVLGYVVTIALLLFMVLQMFNITPYSVMRRIFKNRRIEKEQRKEKAAKRASIRKKHKKFQVFDDSDDIYDEDLLVSPVLPVDMDQIKNDDYSEESNTEQTTLNITRHAVFKDTQPVTAATVYDDSADENQDEAPYNYNDDVEKVPFEEPDDDISNEPEFVLNSYDDGTIDASESYKDDEATEENEPPSDDDLSSYISKDALKKIGLSEEKPAPTQPEVIEEDKEEVVVEKKSLFGSLFGKGKGEKVSSEKKSESAPETKLEPQSEPKPKPKPKKKYMSPPLDFFPTIKQDDADEEAVNEELQNNARIIVETLSNFNAKTKITDISRGPTVTRYELMPEAGVKVRSIANLVDDIALYLAAEGIRIECPIPGKSAVGIEVPNKITSMVYLRSLLEDPQFMAHKSPLYCAIGKSISGEHVYLDIAKTPHLLVAGATGMGKSVCINSILISLLYKSSPDDMRLILIDPKRVEFSAFNGIPHLLVPVVCEAKKSIGTLQWAVAEMERRFELLEIAGVRDIGEYNERVDRGSISAEKIARIVIVIDELYDLKMQVPEIDDHIIRLTQKARAAGIHVIIGTQRPSVDVITGVIKANIPSRIAFRVPAQVDSRTILDEVGAEKLVARGDMLLKPVGALKPLRVQGAFISDSERENVTKFLRENFSANYDEEVISQIDSNTSKLQKAEKKPDYEDGGEGGDDSEALDEKFYAALELATEFGKISSSHLQRKLSLGFQRAARIIDKMEELGYIGPANGSKPRDVLITKEDYLELRMKNEDE